MICTVCGGRHFNRGASVLWPDLINAWQLSREEVQYINRQQGDTCKDCGSNLRSIALADAIRGCLRTSLHLQQLVETEDAKGVSILEINEAGTLTPWLKKFGGYRFGAYPELDMHAMPFPDGHFDLVVHSDTLEHVPNPVHALWECRRILKPGGVLCFTVPIIVGRLTRDRTGLPKSFHGLEADAADDFVVQTEFGADAWAWPMKAGFREVATYAVEYPSALAFAAYKDI